MIDTDATAGSGWLKAERARLVANLQLDGRTFGVRLADVLDGAFERMLERSTVGGRCAIVAMGSYGRREMAPGSDVDVMLLLEGRRRFRRGDLDEAARALWYPLWDAGFALGHAVRTTKEALALADDDLEALTSLLDARFVAGKRELVVELTTKSSELAVRRRERIVRALSEAAAARRATPGPIAEMLEPDLKDGSGGLRDVQSLSWTGLSVGRPAADDPTGGDQARRSDVGLDVLVEHSYLAGPDRDVLIEAREHLLDVRLALHRVTGGKADLLTLQEQDAVAELLRPTRGAQVRDDFDADDAVRELAASGRAVAWIGSDVWDRIDSAIEGTRRSGLVEIAEPGIVERDGRISVTLETGDAFDATVVLRAACAAAEQGVPLEREFLSRCTSMAPVVWDDETRELFVRLLAAGRRAIPVFEALDHVGVLVRILPEWDHVRSRPQRNAYHRFTVDRHLLEAVAECADLATPDDSTSESGGDVESERRDFDRSVAQHCRPDLLLLGALLHDIAKGRPQDHSTAGAHVARDVGSRMGLGSVDTATLAWLVENHLLMADTATRRDLTEEKTILRFGRAVATAARLDLLYILTIGDSRATGPAAWNPARASLVRELFMRTDALLETGIVDSEVAARRRVEVTKLGGNAEILETFPDSYAASFETGQIVEHLKLIERGLPGVAWRELGDHMSTSPSRTRRLEITVVARDRPGLLAQVSGALAVAGMDIHDANVFSTSDGIALEVFVCEDGFGRMSDPDERASAEELMTSVAIGERDIVPMLRERRARYRKPPGAVRTRVDLDASAHATVVEVEAPDEVGLLSTIASVFVELGVDVTLAKVQTLGDRVIDVFYVQDATGTRVTDTLELERLRATIVTRLADELAPL